MFPWVMRFISSLIGPGGRNLVALNGEASGGHSQINGHGSVQLVAE
jgi:hypothetical protein